MKNFSPLGLLPSIMQTLADKNFVRPTEIQSKVMPALLEGRSIVGVAETGGGKTLAYALPILHILKTLENDGDAVSEDAQPRAVVMVPTRDLGEQVTRVIKPFTHTTRIRVRNVLGGTDLDVAKRNITGKFEVLVATPGRLIKLLDRGLLNLSDVRFLVFDEADQMLDQGFLPSATRIANECAERRQMALLSATVSPKVQELIAKLFAEAEMIRSRGHHKVVSGLTTKNIKVENGKRFPHLASLLEDKIEGGTLLFTNTREQCDKLAREMKDAGYTSVTYRGEMDKVERRKNLKLFREGKIQFLVSTDLASRGLDIDHVGRVINYHLPQQMENYIHRVGRTARAGRSGLVVNFVTERDAAFVAKLSAVNYEKSKKVKETSAEWPSEPAHKPRIRVISKPKIIAKA